MNIDSLKHLSMDGKTAVIEGVPFLTGAPVAACDLRAGAAVVIAGLAARGETVVEDIVYIERGYQDLVGKLRSLGADIACVTEPDEFTAAVRAIQPQARVLHVDGGWTSAAAAASI